MGGVAVVDVGGLHIESFEVKSSSQSAGVHGAVVLAGQHLDCAHPSYKYPPMPMCCLHTNSLFNAQKHVSQPLIHVCARCIPCLMLAAMLCFSLSDVQGKACSKWPRTWRFWHGLAGRRTLWLTMQRSSYLGK